MSLTASIRTCLFSSLVCFLSCNHFSIAQNGVDDEKKRSRKAVVLVQNKKLDQALPIFKRLYKSNPESPKYNYYLGFIYLETATDKSVAIPYLQTAYKHKNDWPRVTRYLARAYHLVYQFDDAVIFYEEYMNRLSDDESINSIKHKIEKCHRAKLLVQDTIEAEIANLGSLINTVYPDYAPIISSDDRILIFTSRRPTTTGGRRDVDQLFFEDIYMSVKKKGVWQAPEGVGKNVNTPLHDASIGLSADAQQMFVYHEENIFVSTLEGDVWSNPKKVGSNINTKSWETHACISLDQQVLYFTSDREEGYGGMDIYKALKLPNGKWGLVQNLGPEINTPYNEKAPFIHPADKTLYFSSEGHYNMGGFDIFSSSYVDDKWTTPKNLGHPINTPGDDIFFVVSANGKHTYFSSDLREDNLGRQDIYQLEMPDTGRVKIAIIQGRIYGKDQEPLSARFMVSDQATNKIVGVYNSNARTGKYLLVFPTGKSYNMVIVAKGFTPHRESFTIPEQKYVYNMFQEIGLSHLSRNDSVLGQKIIFRNSFCDIETAIKADSSLSDGDKEEITFSQFLRNLENPEKREGVLVKLKNYNDTERPNIYRCLYEYLPMSQIHLFESTNSDGLETSVIEFEKDTVILNMDTIYKREIIYTTSSSSSSKIELTELDTSINIEFEEFEREVILRNILTIETDEHEKELEASNRDIITSLKNHPETDAKATEIPGDEFKGEKMLFNDLLYDIDKATLTSEYTAQVEKLSGLMVKNPTVTLEISGHTSSTGSETHNQVLSTKRANVVHDYLVNKGISKSRLVARAFGESRPIAPNDTPEGRGKNRRTELKLKTDND